MTQNAPKVAKILEKLASYLLDSMMAFEYSRGTYKLASIEKAWHCEVKSLDPFNKWLDKAMIWDNDDRKKNGGCFFLWLALLPYEATHNTEALL